jgi:hypothetical protein
VGLTATQEGIWFAEQLDPGRSGYHDAVTVHLDGPLDVELLRESLADCHARHDALRLRVRVREARGALVQSFDAAVPPWHQHDLSGLTPQRQAADGRRLFGLDCTEPFDLAGGPLWRLRLLRLNETEHRLLLVLHHLMSDGWSHGVFLHTLLSCYAARRNRTKPPAPAPSFRDWALRRIAAERASADQARAAAADLSGTPRRFALPGLRAGRVIRGAVHPLPITTDTLAAFNAACAARGVSRYMAMTGLFAHLVQDLAGTGEVVLAAPVADRLSPGSDRIVGCMINAVPIRITATGPGAWSAVAAGRAGVVSALRLLDVPYRDVVRATGITAGAALADPLTNLACEEFNSPRGTWQVGELRITTVPRGEFQTRHDLTLCVPRAPDSAPELLFPMACWSTGAIESLAGSLAELLGAFGQEVAAARGTGITTE